MKRAPRVLILTPTALPSVTGNAVTAERWRLALGARGLTVRVVAALGLKASDFLSALDGFLPDVIHVHHAFRAGSLLLDPGVASACEDRPVVVSPAGTDIHLDLEIQDRREVVTRVCGRARTLVAQGEETLRRLRELLPHLGDRIAHVAKSFAWLGHDPFDLRAVSGVEPDEVLFFLPAGVRPVKGNLDCLLALERVHSRRPQMRALFAGPALDPEYAARFQREVRRCSAFARWIPPIPPTAMRAAYRGSDVVLNASLAEGLSNAIMEATSAGRPVLASRIPGNQWPVLGEAGDQPAGLLYDQADPEDLVCKAVALIDDTALRRTLGEAGRERVARLPGPEAEARGLAAVYEKALGCQ